MSKPKRTHVEPPEPVQVDDWRDDALRDFDNGLFNRGVAVLLGIVDRLPCDFPSGIDRNNARRWQREYAERLASRARSRAKREAARLRRQ
jgi:hypothetical protein